LLTPTPFYGGFVFSSHLYSKVELILVHLDSEGKKVRGLVLINPQNPLGDVYSRDSLKEYLEFAKT